MQKSGHTENVVASLVVIGSLVIDVNFFADFFDNFVGSAKRKEFQYERYCELSENPSFENV